MTKKCKFKIVERIISKIYIYIYPRNPEKITGQNFEEKKI